MKVMRRMRNNVENERGEVMLEALIVYSITTFLLFLILALFSIMYQSWNVQIIANETATRVAQTYRLEQADIITGYATEEEIANIGLYRYIFGHDEDILNAQTSKLSLYANERLLKTTYTRRVTEPQINVTVETDALARRHIKVNIWGAYTVPFGEALAFFGFDSIASYNVTVYAECVDLLDYVSTVDYTDNLTSLGWLGSEVIGAMDKLLNLINHIINL